VFSQNHIKELWTGTCLFSLAVPLYGQNQELKIISVNPSFIGLYGFSDTQSKSYSECGVDPNEMNEKEKEKAKKHQQAEVAISFFTSSSLLAEQLGISCGNSEFVLQMAILANPMWDDCKKVYCPTDALGKLAEIIQPDWHHIQ